MAAGGAAGPQQDEPQCMIQLTTIEIGDDSWQVLLVLSIYHVGRILKKKNLRVIFFFFTIRKVFIFSRKLNINVTVK